MSDNLLLTGLTHTSEEHAHSSGEFAICWSSKIENTYVLHFIKIDEKPPIFPEAVFNLMAAPSRHNIQTIKDSGNVYLAMINTNTFSSHFAGGSTMFKDFDRRMQRDVKRIVDARLRITEQLSGGRIKVRKEA